MANFRRLSRFGHRTLLPAPQRYLLVRAIWRLGGEGTVSEVRKTIQSWGDKRVHRTLQFQLEQLVDDGYLRVARSLGTGPKAPKVYAAEVEEVSFLELECRYFLDHFIGDSEAPLERLEQLVHERLEKVRAGKVEATEEVSAATVSSS